MAKINLLPWREELRKQQQQDFIVNIAVSVIFTFLALVGVHFYIEDLKDYHNARNQKLRDEIAILDVKLREIKDIEAKKSKLLTKIEVIYGLQESRPQIVHLFEEMAKTAPEGIYLTSFKQNGKALTMTGRAESNARVSAYMRAIDASEWVQSPTLNIIRGQGAKQAGHPNDFTMYAVQGKKKVNKDQDGGAS